MADVRYWVWLTTIEGLGLRAQQDLLAAFSTPEAVFLADQEAIDRVEGLTDREKEALQRRDLRRADEVLEDCQRERIRVLTIQDAAYPQRLGAIARPPLVLYYKGELLPFDALPVTAVVGARNASGYGLTMSRRLGYELGLCGSTVVSGAARGIDAKALEGALAAGAPVAAVLGNGLDVVYPSGSERLYHDVMEHGCLLSEYVPGTRPLGSNFPRRNRIMSGLSLAVVVVEAAKKSGSLITAEHALEQGREVFAVPGNVGLACCEGSNQLLREGATLARCGWDVLQGFAARFPGQLQDNVSGEKRPKAVAEKVRTPAPARKTAGKNTKSGNSEAEPEKRIDNGQKRNYIDLQQILPALSEDERTMAELLRAGEMHVDDIIAESGLPPARVLSSLTLLEVKGYVVQSPGKRFALAPNVTQSPGTEK